MYSVLVVDDEEPARETLRYLVNWEDTSFRIDALAKNGKEAFDEYETLKPQLIITDIQMPVMDGLELIRRIRIKNRNQKFVVLSCHENFNYAKEAIKLGVSDYLLKDLLTPQDLYSLLGKIKSEIEAENRGGLYGCNYSTPIDLFMKDDFYKEECKNIALKGIVFENLAVDTLNFYIKEFNLNFHSKYYAVFCIVIDGYTKYIEKLEKMQEKRNRLEILNIIKDTLDQFNGGECICDEKGAFIAIAGIENTNSEYAFWSSCYTIADKIHSNLMRLKDITVSVGVSSRLSNLKEIKAKYDEALEVVKYKTFLGKGKTISYNAKLVKITKLDYEVLDGHLSDIRTNLAETDMVKVDGILKVLYNNEKNGYVQYDYLRYMNSKILGIIVEYCSKNNISYSKVFGCEYLPVEKLEEFETIEEMLNWFRSIINKLLDSNRSNSDLVYSKHVHDAIRYIRTNYGCKLGLSQISKRLNVNNAYLCRIFKNETGENITDFVNKVRIEEAIQFMKSTNYKIYEIAEKVGFTNIQHFNNSFKKIVGESPLKFRNQKYSY